MTRVPLIGISGRRKTGRQVSDLPEYFDDMKIDMYFSNYAEAVSAAGGIPLHLPLNLDSQHVVEHLDGLLLSGGTDIEASRYGVDAQSNLFPPEPERDEFELDILKQATKKQIPVLGICRGQQLVNVGFGGTLHQDVPAHSKAEVWQKDDRHEVEIQPDSILHSLYGAVLQVNSLHHQSVDSVGEGLQVTAWSSDGIAEGLEHAEFPVLCVQWHPEMLPTRDSDPIFSWLVHQASKS